MAIIYKSDELFKEITEKYQFVDKKNLKNSTENELMHMSGQTGDNIFIQYGIARKWDEAEKKRRRSEFLQRKFWK